MDVLDAHVFASIEEVRVVIDEWLEDNNGERPYDSSAGGHRVRHAEATQRDGDQF